MPIAPPITVASEQKATTRQPLMVPTAASIPESSSGVISSTDPGSSRARSRKLGLRGSWSRGILILAGGAGVAAAAVGGGAMVVIGGLLLHRSW